MADQLLKGGLDWMALWCRGPYLDKPLNEQEKKRWKSLTKRLIKINEFKKLGKNITMTKWYKIKTEWPENDTLVATDIIRKHVDRNQSWKKSKVSEKS